MRLVGEEMYVIKNGSVQVYLKHGTQVQPLATLTTGNFFGEGALLKGRSARRAANVCSTTYSLIYSLHVEAMSGVLPRYPKVQETIAAIAEQRERDTATMSVHAFRLKHPDVISQVVRRNSDMNDPPAAPAPAPTPQAHKEVAPVAPDGCPS